jgi:hypothetical protein
MSESVAGRIETMRGSLACDHAGIMRKIKTPRLLAGAFAFLEAP